jgi:hypothetical protein
MVLQDDLFLPEMKQKFTATIQGQSTLNRDTGEWEPGTSQDVSFEGVLLPLTSRDLNQLQTISGGQFSLNDKKLYTQYLQTFLNETNIKTKDVQGNDITYQVYTIKDYGISSNLRRYYVKKLDKVSG